MQTMLKQSEHTQSTPRALAERTHDVGPTSLDMLLLSFKTGQSTLFYSSERKMESMVELKWDQLATICSTYSRRKILKWHSAKMAKYRITSPFWMIC